MSTVTRDITERKQAEESLRESEEELRTLTESIPNIVWMTRPVGWVLYCNQRWTEYTGLSVAETCGYGWIDPFHPDDRQACRWDVLEACRGNW